jgi:hypothetical protein
MAAIKPTDKPDSGCGGGVGGGSSAAEADFVKTLPASSCVATRYNRYSAYTLITIVVMAVRRYQLRQRR